MSNPRTTQTQVQAIVDTDDSVWSQEFIITANLLTDRVASNCSELSANELAEIEKYLAAHFYALRDPQYIQKKTGQASATFQGQTSMGFGSTFWGQTAMSLDVCGTLAQMSNGSAKVGLHWIGTDPDA